jgi:hypothetical protein
VVSVTGDRVLRANCPNCGETSVVYNGNYWCDSPGCGWIMGGGGETPTDAAIIESYLIQRAEEALVRKDSQEVDRMRFYLRELEERKK